MRAFILFYFRERQTDRQTDIQRDPVLRFPDHEPGAIDIILWVRVFYQRERERERERDGGREGGREGGAEGGRQRVQEEKTPALYRRAAV